MELDAQLKRLQAAASPIVAQLSVAGVFECLLRANVASRGAAATPAIAACLGHACKVAVQEAVQRLIIAATQGSLPMAMCQEALMAALPTANSPATAGSLAQGLLHLLIFTATQDPQGQQQQGQQQQGQQQQGQGRGHQQGQQGVPGWQPRLALSASSGVSDLGLVPMPVPGSGPGGQGWAQHPLSSALLLNFHCGSNLVAACCSALHSACRQTRQQRQQQQLWHALEPFFSFCFMKVLLLAHAVVHKAASSSSSSWVALGSTLHSQLVRLGCSQPLMTLPVLRLLLGLMAGAPAAHPARQLALLQHIPDLLDLMDLLWQQAEEEEEGEQQQGSGLQAAHQRGPGGVGAAAAGGVVLAGPAAAAAPLLAQCLADTLLQLAWDCVSGSSSNGGGSGGGGRGEQPGLGGVEVLAQAAQAKSSVSGGSSGAAGWLGCAGSGLDEGLGGEEIK